MIALLKEVSRISIMVNFSRKLEDNNIDEQDENTLKNSQQIIARKFVANYHAQLIVARKFAGLKQ